MYTIIHITGVFNNYYLLDMNTNYYYSNWVSCGFFYVINLCVFKYALEENMFLGEQCLLSMGI